MANRIQLRRGTQAEGIAANPVLAVAEIAVETDTNQYKIGNGVTNWVTLPYGGLKGDTGDQGIQGIPGDSIIWQGSLASAPSSPEVNWGYYDTVLKKSYIWDGDSWEIIAVDGIDGGVTLPVGFVYFQMPGKDSPSTLGLAGTWSNVSTSWPGDFLRIEGGNASAFEAGQQANQNKSHTHTQNSHNHTQDSHNHTQDTHIHTMPTHKHLAGWRNEVGTPTSEAVYGFGSTVYTTGARWNIVITNSSSWKQNWGSTVDPGDTNTKVATNQATTPTNIATTATNQTDGGTESWPNNRTIRVWERVS